MAMFKHFWPALKEFIFAICNSFTLGTVDISRLNFGVLSLIPKVHRADNICHFSPIALVNVSFKIFAKACTSLMNPIAHKMIYRQFVFLKGRYILEGRELLQEIVSSNVLTNMLFFSSLITRKLMIEVVDLFLERYSFTWGLLLLGCTA